MDNFKKATVKDYTAWDLNCKKICPHDKSSNKLEKRIQRKPRRIFQQKLKQVSTKSSRRAIIQVQ